MTFTYTESPATVNIDFVRFYTGDVVSAQSFLSDELITSLITLEGTKQKATIAAVEHIIARLSQPDFKADWLTVTNSKAREAYEGMRSTLMTKFALGGISVNARYTYRADSAQTEESDYTDGRPGRFGDDYEDD